MLICLVLLRKIVWLIETLVIFLRDRVKGYLLYMSCSPVFSRESDQGLRVKHFFFLLYVDD